MTLHAMFEAGPMILKWFCRWPVTDGANTTRFIPSATLACRRKDEKGSGFFTCEFAGQLKGNCSLPRHWRRQRALPNTLAVINDLIEAGKYVEFWLSGARPRGERSLLPRVLMQRDHTFFLDNL